MELLENYPCNNKYELETRERYHIENNECINRMIPTRTSKEWRDDNKEIIKENKKIYAINNREKLNKY